MNPRLTTSLTACTLVVLSALKAGSAQPDELSWSTINNGGGTSANGFFGLSGTVGQAAAGTMNNEYSGMMSNKVYQIEGGFWAAALRTRPLIGAPLAGVTNANLNEIHTFTALPVGTPPFQYQWRLNGVNLPGETNNTLTISITNRAQGGAYSWVAVNEFGVASSGPAELQFNLPLNPLTNDYFTNRIELATPEFKANNVGATNEPGEPLHGDSAGGASVWYSWSTNASGIATFRTEGSAFDTLLAVYTGNNVETLVPVAKDDDSRNFLTSEVRFNVSTGTVYQIAIDGSRGGQGGFIVSWEFLATTNRLPLITCHPMSQAVRLGNDATFKVDDGVNQPGLTYQWHFKGERIPDATNARLTISPASFLNVGWYNVSVTNAAGLGLESQRASLEIGPKPTAVSYNKLEDLLVNSGYFGAYTGACTASPRAHMFQPAGLSFAPIQSVTVGVGSGGDQRFSTGGYSSQCTTCDILSGNVKYYGLMASNSGVMVLDTSASTNRAAGKRLDTILMVYEYTNSRTYLEAPSKGNECNFKIACDDDGGPDGTSYVRFPAVASRYYVAEVNTKNDEVGDVGLKWDFYPPPTPLTNVNGALYLTANTNLSLYPGVANYSWLTNGALQEETTVPWLHLNRPIVPAVAYAVAMYVQNLTSTSWYVERLTNNLCTIVAARSELDASRKTNRVVLEGLASGPLSTNLQVEASTGSGTNAAAAWQWQTVTNFTRSTNMANQITNLILSFPANQAKQFLRISPKTQ